MIVIPAVFSDVHKCKELFETDLSQYETDLYGETSGPKTYWVLEPPKTRTGAKGPSC